MPIVDCNREVKNIYVTSTNRNTSQYPSGNSYTLYLTTPIKDISKVEILYASIPNTMYNLTNGTDVISFTNNAVETIFTIPVGFYGATTLATAIYNASWSTSQVKCSFLPAEGKFLFTRSTNFVMQILTKELANLLGFTFPAYEQSIDASTTPYATNIAYTGLFYIKSDYVVDMNVNDGVFLDIQELRTMYNECAPQGTPNDTTNNNTANRSFGMIPMDVSSGCIKRFKKSGDYDIQVDYTYPIQKLDRLTVSWTDKNGTLLNFNGADDNAFILRFHTLRKNLC